MSDPEADLVIVGAGSAGSVLASRLSADPARRVLLIEAGAEPADPRIARPADWPLLQGSAIDWGYETVPQPGLAGRIEPCPRGRVVGGSSCLHAMGHMRGHPADFAAWGVPGWGWDDLAPWFARSEASPFAGEPGYGADGPLPLMQPAPPHPLTRAHLAAGAALGLAPLRDHNGGCMAGPALNTLTIRDGRRVSAADAYLTPAVRARPNLAIATGLLADRLVLSPEGRAIGVEVLAAGVRRRLPARRGVVLAAGSIGTPALLMRSGLGPAADLAALGIAPVRDLPGIGANLQDHLLAANLYRARQPVPPTGTQHSEALTYIDAAGTERGAAPALVAGIATAPIAPPGALAGPAPGFGTAYTILFGITHPASRGRVTLASSDPAAPPRIDPAYLADPRDRALMREALGWARRLGQAAPYDAWRGEELLPGPGDLASEAATDAFIARAAFTHHHPVGTCRMGADPAAPVGPDLALRGIAGLWVADGSVIPSLTTGPVHAAILALAERAAALLAQA